jgi:hypothetical protein
MTPDTPKRLRMFAGLAGLTQLTLVRKRPAMQGIVDGCKEMEQGRRRKPGS